jgi:hypothetical protein
MSYVLTFTSAQVEDIDGLPAVAAYGPYRTEAEAQRDIDGHDLPDLGGGHWEVVELRRPSLLATDTGAERPDWSRFGLVDVEEEEPRVVTIPIDACICEGRVSRPRANCWATTHELREAQR